MELERILDKDTVAYVSHKTKDVNGFIVDPDADPTVVLNVRSTEVKTLTPIKQAVGHYVVEVDTTDLQESLNYHDVWTYTINSVQKVDTNDIWVLYTTLNLKGVDIGYARIQSRDWFNLATVAREYYVHDKNAPSAPRNKFGEPILGEAVYTLFPEPVRCHIQLNPKKSELTRFGLDEGQDGIVTFSRQVLDDLGLEPEIGDKIVFYSQEYRIDVVRPDGYLSGSEIPMNLQAVVNVPNTKDVANG